MKLAGQRAVNWQNRAHFFGIAAQLMRRILVDHARHHSRAKRGGEVQRLSIEEADPAAPITMDVVDAYTLDQALVRLESLDAQQGRIVELRFFGGLTIEETAEVMRLSPGTVKRDWAVARAWLFRELSDEVESQRE
jgi:RNA polymerase sigma factor (TIGR02999 family)